MPRYFQKYSLNCDRVAIKVYKDRISTIYCKTVTVTSIYELNRRKATLKLI